jgi:ABC-2 type transport system ATP-binding protein
MEPVVAVERLQGLRSPDGGTMRVLGLDPTKEAGQLRRRIGSQLQESALPDRIKVREALDLFAAFALEPADCRALLERWELWEHRDAAFGSLSGGQRQRLFVALALVNQPQLVFFDEVTEGLDPQARHMAWDVIRAVRDEGATIVLVTHFMDEAEQLCDRVAVVDHGKVIALGTPAALIASLGAQYVVEFGLADGVTLEDDALQTLPGVVGIRREEQLWRLQVAELHTVMPALLSLVDTRRAALTELRTHAPTLEDVFVSLTGRHLRDA